MQRPRLSPKSPLGEAISYARSNWTALTRYTEQGYLSIDNNASERAMRNVVVGRKNWLFAEFAERMCLSEAPLQEG